MVEDKIFKATPVNSKELQKGLDVVGKGGVVHVKCHTTVHRVSDISDSKIIKPYTEGSYNKIYITK